jgi:hypothetical protein
MESFKSANTAKRFDVGKLVGVDIRESSPEECVQLCTKFSVELSQQCEFAKFVISLPFPTVNDISLNEKIQKFNILMQYKFLSHPTVSLLDNSGLSFRGRPEDQSLGFVCHD